MELPKRKPNRLPNFDYSTPGVCFFTICTQGSTYILGEIVGGVEGAVPYNDLTEETL